MYSGIWRGQICAIKVRDSSSLQGVKEFVKEIHILGNHRHEHLLPLLGFCITKLSDNLFCALVYPKMKSSLEDALGGTREFGVLNAQDRVAIARDAAAGLEYLHSAVNKPVILHRDIKSSNILLDDHKRAKISDVGLACPMAAAEPESQTLGTFGYIDPYYGNTGQYTPASDVFSFGVILLELLTGQKATDATQNPASLHERCRDSLLNHPAAFLDHAAVWSHLSVDPLIGVALSCINLNVSSRPTSQEIVQRLAFILDLSQQIQEPQEQAEQSSHSAVPQPPPQLPLPEDRECQVCMQASRGARLRPCCHVFCQRCAERAVQVERKCPLCRGQVTSYEVGDFYDTFVPIVAV